MRKIVKQKYNLYMMILLQVFVCATAQAGKGSMVTVNGYGQAVIDGEDSFDQARYKALNQARAIAVEKAAGISISSFSILDKNLIVADYIKTFSRGFIVEEKVLSWDQGWLKSSLEDQPDFPIIKVQIRASVLVPDESFFKKDILKVKLSKSRYRNGDQAHIHVESTQAVRVLLANYTGKGQMVHLYPNPYYPSRVVDAEHSLDIPGGMGINIELSGVPEQEQATEAFIVIALPEAETAAVDWTQFKANEAVSYSDYMSRVMKLPISWLSEEIKTYSISWP